MLDRDLAELYGVEMRVLNQAVKRNVTRFPADLMFLLNKEEEEASRSQLVTLKKGRGQHRKYPTSVLAEQGVAMLSSVLNSERTVQVNIAIIRTVVKLREMMASHKDLARKLEELEKKYDGQFQVVFDAIRQLITVDERPKRKIGYISESRVVYRTSGKRGMSKGRA